MHPYKQQVSDEIIAVTEFYQTTDGLQAEVRRAQIHSWMIVGGVMLGIYVLLSGIVERASRVILTQQADLQAHVANLQTLLTQNETFTRAYSAGSGAYNSLE